jgi:hypothetical protein
MNKNSTEKQNFLSCISNQMQLHSKSFPAVFSHPVSHPGNFCAQKRNYLRAEKILSPRIKELFSTEKNIFLRAIKMRLFRFWIFFLMDVFHMSPFF